MSMAYPAARRDEKAGTTYKSAEKGTVFVPEPYTWLETPPSQSAETKTWVHAQAELTQQYLQGCQPHLDTLKEKIESNFNYARVSCPSVKGNGRAYFSYNPGLKPQSIIYGCDLPTMAADMAGPRAKDATQQPPGQVYFDTNLLDPKGNTALTLINYAKSGKYMAYGIAKSGSDWFKIFVRPTDKPFCLPQAAYDAEAAGKPWSDAEKMPYVDAEGGADRLPDVLDNLKFSSAAWTHDDAGFFYQTYPAPKTVLKEEAGADKGTETDANKHAQMWYHTLGTQQSEDALIIPADANCPESMWSPRVSEDGAYLLVQNSRDTDTKSRLFVAKLNGAAPLAFVPLCHTFAYDLDYITNDGTRFYFMTNKDAPKYRIVYADLDLAKAKPAPVWEQVVGATAKEDVVLHDLVKEDPEALLSSASVVAENKLLLVYSRDVKDELYQYDLKTGKRVARLLPDLVGTISQIAGRREDHRAFVSFTSFVNPGQIVYFDWTEKSAGDHAVAKQGLWYQTLVKNIKAEDFVSTQEFVTSKDGTRVPMFLTSPKTVKRDGSSPAILYFYGGFNISITPTFSASMMTWASMYNGTIAFVNARGGGEYGEEWHEAGCRLNKQNVFDDVLSAAKYLHEQGIAQKGKIILCGGSNGGLGVAACVNQCEEEHGVGAGIADVGVMDMLKFYTWTIGKAWTADYGNPSEDPVIFDYNYKYSPLHNVRTDKTYPLTILACADHDDRVVPAHSFKLMAEMQHKLPNNPQPLLLRVEIDAGHGAGKSTQKRITESAEKYAIVARGLGLTLRT